MKDRISLPYEQASSCGRQAKSIWQYCNPRADAHEVVDMLAKLRVDQGSAMLEITLLRLRALLTPRDDVADRDLLSR